jgi:hypothetical protein
MILGNGFYAHLTPWMISEADSDAHKKAEWNRRRGHQGGNNLRNNDRIDYDILGSRCEKAGHVFLPMLTWHKFDENYQFDRADLGEFVDVKGVPFDSYSLNIQINQLNPMYAYLAISGEHHPYYWVRGWRWGWELKDRNNIVEWIKGRPTWTWPRDEPLRSIMELQTIARGLEEAT